MSDLRLLQLTHPLTGRSFEQGCTSARLCQYGSNWKSPDCGRILTISYKDKTARAKVVDECPGCPYGGLDLTEGLFSYLAPLGDGVIQAQWWFD
ncbi:hypothetical protein OF83DRAFT_1130054 [Amylostereum chailletii]|nr:hypothetical protein OF83DRAFT_1130054 [Amylostereum chailletii]